MNHEKGQSRHLNAIAILGKFFSASLFFHSHYCFSFAFNAALQISSWKVKNASENLEKDYKNIMYFLQETLEQTGSKRYMESSHVNLFLFVVQ